MSVGILRIVVLQLVGMRIWLFCLILLSVPVVRIKEACNSNSDRQKTLSNSLLDGEGGEKLVDIPSTGFDLLIFGGGVQAWKFLQEHSQLFNPFIQVKKIKIGIIETKSKLGPGLPYDEDAVIHEHLMHRVDAAVKMDQTEDYMVEQRPIIDDSADAYERAVLLHPTPRYAMGGWIIDKFDVSLKKYEKYNRKITIMQDTTAVNVQRLDSGDGFIVTLTGDHEGTITTTNIFLATGHWYASRFGKDVTVEGYYESPWPASKLKREITKALHMAIFGCGLSAIDAALTLAHKFGGFEYKDKRFYFGIKEEYKEGDFKITMYCRSGHLPPVAGTLTKERPKSRLLNKALKISEKGRKKLLPLKEVLKVLKEDLVSLVPGIKTTTNRFNKMDARELIDHINFFAYQDKDYKQRLIDDIEASRNSVINNDPLLLPVFFTSLLTPFNIFLEYFSAEDTATFKEYVASAISKWTSVIPPHNAEKLFALMNASCLFLEAVGDDSNVTENEETKEGVHIHFNGKKVYHRYFIDAKGQSGDIEKDTRPLTQNLLKNKLIQPMYIPYSNKKKGKEDMDEEMKKNPTSDKIKLGADKKFYHKADGIAVNWRTMHAIPVGQTKEQVIKNARKGVIYASGPFTYHCYSLEQSFSIAKLIGGIVADDMRGRGQ